MTSAELKQTLIDIAQALQAIEQIWPKNANLPEMVQVLNTLNDPSLQVISALVRIPVNDLKGMIPNIVKMVESTDHIFSTGEGTTLANMLNGLSNRPIILAMIARFL